MKRTIGFYGAGNMAQAIISGLINSGFYQKEEIYVYNHRYEPTLKKVEETYGIQVILREEELFQQSDLIIFAVKPTILTQILL
ncbi:MAG: NAD(P)-binding domain-containing protein, partial [Tetragenococcus halophilus]|nr:NAD(P)-binding domain-containing protein [Tetragenococcus halophilus]